MHTPKEAKQGRELGVPQGGAQAGLKITETIRHSVEELKLGVAVL